MHTPLPRAWLRNCRQGVCLATLASLLHATLPAADENPGVVFQFLDEETKAPLASARILVDSMNDEGHYGPTFYLPSDPLDEPKWVPSRPGEPPRPPPHGWTMADAAGVAILPVPNAEADMVILHERGVAYLRGEERKESAGKPVSVKLQPWATLEGRVLTGGKPRAGAIVTLSRDWGMRGGWIGSCCLMFHEPVNHGANAVTDANGKFKFVRLLPNLPDAERIMPYQYRRLPVQTAKDQNTFYTIRATVRTAGAPPGASLINDGYTPYIREPQMNLEPGAWSATIQREQMSFTAGQRATVELEAPPLCVRKVTGRLIWADGKTLVASRDLPKEDYRRTPRLTHAVYGASYIQGGTEKDWHYEVQEDGRFTAIMPFVGTWRLEFDTLCFKNGITAHEFTVPACPGGNETGDLVDLGDIIVQDKVARVPSKPPPTAASETRDTRLKIVDVKGEPLEGVKAKIVDLQGNTQNGGYSFGAKDPLATESAKDGTVRFQAPILAQWPGEDNPGEWRKITHIQVDVECSGYDKSSNIVAVGSQNTVVTLQRLIPSGVRVTLDGRVLAVEEYRLEGGWKWHGSHPDTAAIRENNLFSFTGLPMDATTPPKGIWQAQAAHLAADGSRWFSDVREIAQATEHGGLAPELPLKRGVLLEGQIAEAVPRPVKHGFVRVVVLMPESKGAEAHRIYWCDWQALDEAGKFSFKGLPPGEAWIAASCDGWISEDWPIQPEALSPAGAAVHGEPVSMQWNAQPVTFESDVRDHVIPVTRTGSCILRFTRADGSPVVGASPWWNPSLYAGGTLQEYRALDHLLRAPQQEEYPPPAFLSGEIQKTNAKGELKVENLPPGKARFAMRAEHAYLQPAIAGVDDHPATDALAPFEVMIKAGEAAKIDFVVKP